MAYPSNYRWDPFTNVATNVNNSELHIIPSKSPYTIRLNEVPAKSDPSTMVVKEVTAINSTTRTYGTTFTEVAASPSGTQFRPDYSTGANGDENWNTGMIEFSSSDAGKVVEVQYQGTGTLAGVVDNRYPPSWLDRGDGSEGDVVITGNKSITGIHNYKSLVINSGVTLTVTKGALIKVQETLWNKGTISANGQGAPGGSGAVGSSSDSYTSPKAGSAGAVSSGGAGAAYSNGVSTSSGGAGGGSGLFLGTSLNADMIKRIIKENINLVFGFGAGGGGSACLDRHNYRGGNGGAGGGHISIVCSEFRNNGTVSSNGNSGTTGSQSSYKGGSGGGAQYAA